MPHKHTESNYPHLQVIKPTASYFWTERATVNSFNHTSVKWAYKYSFCGTLSVLDLHVWNDKRKKTSENCDGEALDV